MEPTIEERPDTTTQELPPFSNTERTDEGHPIDEQWLPIATPPVEAIASALAQNAQHFAGAEEAERRQELVDDNGDIFSGPFDPVEAVKAITEINRECIAAKAEWEQSKAQTKEFKDAYDEAVGRLTRVCSRYDALRRRSATEQPLLKNVADETIGQRRDRLAPLLVMRGLIVTAADLEPLSREQLDTLEHWSAHEGPIPPELVAKNAHVAGQPGTSGQHCTRCGASIPAPLEGHTYVAGQLVGLDCRGVDLDEVRAPRPRARKGRKRVNHEAESQQQRSEGAKRSRK